MKIPQGLHRIAQALDAPLYIVGGYVRNGLLWGTYRDTDIDVCSRLTPENIIAKLEGIAKVVNINPKIGTLKLLIGQEEYEYTCFRKDSYPKGGRHTPENVIFVEDIKEDAARRDFTVNALYLDVLNGEILDPTGKGVKDLESKLIRAADNPEKVFFEDGLRLLRLARFAAELGFKIENATFAAAANNNRNLADIAPERKRAEFDKILIADTRYGVADAHYDGLITIGQLELWKYIIPEIEQGIGLLQRADIHKYDVYLHTLEAVRVSPPEIRLAALLHDIGKPQAVKEDGNMYRHASLGADIAKAALNRLRYPKAVIERTVRLISNHMYDLDGKTGISKLRVFVQKNYDIMEDLLKLREADGKATGREFDGSIVERMRNCYKSMRDNRIPFELKDLEINGIDVIELGGKGPELSAILKGVLTVSAKEGRRLNREEQLDVALRLLNER